MQLYKSLEISRVQLSALYREYARNRLEWGGDTSHSIQIRSRAFASVRERSLDAEIVENRVRVMLSSYEPKGLETDPH